MLRKRPQVLGVELNRSVSAARRLTRWRGSTHKGRPVRNVPRKKQGGHYLHRERAGVSWPGWHRQSIRAETATQNPHTSRGCITGALCISRIWLITHVRRGALGGRFKICLRRCTCPKRARSFRCSTRWPAVPQLSPEQARVSVVESRAV